MRLTSVAATVIILANSVHAQAQTIVEACKRVVVFELEISNLQASDVQAFPELSPHAFECA